MKRILQFATLICWASIRIWAADIPIANAGFEQVVPGCAPGGGCGAFQTVTGWTGTGQFWTLKPSVGAGGVFTSGIPEGLNVAALGANTSDLGGSGILLQTLDATLQPGTTYTLGFFVGCRPDYPFAGYRVELLAGSTTVASDSSLAPPSGTFVAGRIVYSSNADPTLLGQKLGIRLTGYKGGQAEFDKISLDATPAVISSSLSQIASGGGWKTSIAVISLAPTRQTIRVNARGDDGNPLSLPFVVTQQGTSQPLTASSVVRDVDPGATLLIESEAPVSSPTMVGWAEVISSGPVTGYAIFRMRGQDGRDSEGTSLLENSAASNLILPFDNAAGFVTGVALVNRTAEAAIISAKIRDDNGVQIGLDAVALPAMAHASFAVTDRFVVTRGRRGTIEFNNISGGALTGIGLRFSPTNSFTSLPATHQ